MNYTVILDFAEAINMTVAARFLAALSAEGLNYSARQDGHRLTVTVSA